MAFFSDAIDIKTGIGRRLSRTPEASIKTAVGQAKAGISSPAKICLAFPDGYNRSFDPVLKTLNSELGNDCPVFGGAAGTLLHESDTILQFYQDEILEDSMPIMIFGGPIEYSFSIVNSCRRIYPHG